MVIQRFLIKIRNHLRGSSELRFFSVFHCKILGPSWSRRFVRGEGGDKAPSASLATPRRSGATPSVRPPHIWHFLFTLFGFGVLEGSGSGSGIGLAFASPSLEVGSGLALLALFRTETGSGIGPRFARPLLDGIGLALLSFVFSRAFDRIQFVFARLVVGFFIGFLLGVVFLSYEKF